MTLILELMDGGELQEFVDDGALGLTRILLAGLASSVFVVYVQAEDARKHYSPTQHFGS